MRRFASLLALCGGLLAAVCSAPSTVSAREPGQEIIRCGQQTPIKGSPRFFTGTVRIDPLYAANNAMRSSGGSVTFEPGARSHWHIHPVGQVLIVTAGVGLTQEWGKPIQEIRAGELFHFDIPPDYFLYSPLGFSFLNCAFIIQKPCKVHYRGNVRRL